MTVSCNGGRCYYGRMEALLCKMPGNSIKRNEGGATTTTVAQEKKRKCVATLEHGMAMTVVRSVSWSQLPPGVGTTAQRSRPGAVMKLSVVTSLAMQTEERLGKARTTARVRQAGRRRR